MKKYAYAIIFSIVLTLYTAYTLLDAFVIPHDIVRLPELENYSAQHSTTVPEEFTPTEESIELDNSADISEKVETAELSESLEISETSETAQSAETTEELPIEPQITETSYIDENISINITTLREHDTDIHVADVVISDISYLKAGLAEGGFGRNLKQITSAMAEDYGAIFAVNGDYYGFRSEGFVQRNGYLYRKTPRTGDSQALVIYDDGSFEIVTESEANAEELAANGSLQIFSFGPGLVQNGEVIVSDGEEVDRAKLSNPRTAIGVIEPLHYIFVVSDGRTDQNLGLTLRQLGEVMQSLGCETAYNLDGGGSSTMWFMGKIINYPTSYGEYSSERGVSDIVYIG